MHTPQTWICLAVIYFGVLMLVGYAKGRMK